MGERPGCLGKIERDRGACSGIRTEGCGAEENEWTLRRMRRGAKSPAELIDERIAQLADWRGEMLSRLRALVKQADPEIVEEWKWRGVPVWSCAGIICTGETYKNIVKMTFANGASLADPFYLFNASLDGNTRRAIDFREGDSIDEEAVKALVRAAVALNRSKERR